jgi:hypothetical protein
MGHATTFYPSALTLDEAKTIRLSPVKSPMPSAPIEIVLRSARLSVVSGQVLGAAGGPVRGGTLELAHLDGLHGYDTRTIDIRPDGTFEIPALQPGGYFLQHFEAGLPTGRPTDWKVSRATVRVADRDVVDVRVLPVSMVRVSGRVVVDPAQQPLLIPRASASRRGRSMPTTTRDPRSSATHVRTGLSSSSRGPASAVCR